MSEIYRYTVRLSDNLGDKFIFGTDKYDVYICPTESGVIATNKKSGEETIIPWTSIKYLTKKAIAGRFPWPEDEVDLPVYDPTMVKSDKHLAPENLEDMGND